MIDKKTYIYGLRLGGDQYYIGKTNRFPDRFEEHLNKDGANWTILHSINEIIFIVEKIEDNYENDYTFLFMEKYGLENVRGGGFCQLDFNEKDKIIISERIKLLNLNIDRKNILLSKINKDLLNVLMNKIVKLNTIITILFVFHHLKLNLNLFM
jgi:hypothetical protein